MKFSHSLQFNSVPEWKDNYINYSNLKKIIYALQEAVILRETGSSTNTIVDKSNNKDDIKLSTFKAKFSHPFFDKLKKDSDSLNDDDNNNNFNHNSNSSYSSNDDNELVRTQTINILDEANESLIESLDQSNFFDHNSGKLDFSTLNLTKFPPKTYFKLKLDEQLLKIDKFYSEKENEYFFEVEQLLKDLTKYDENHYQLSKVKTNDTSKFLDQHKNRRLSQIKIEHEHQSLDLEKGKSRTSTSGASVFYDDDDDEEEEEEDYDEHSPTSALLGDRDFNLSNQHTITFKMRITNVFVELSQLKSYIELNKIGFAKVCKKFDKVLEESIKDNYLQNLHNKSYIFNKTTIIKVDEYLDQLTKVYSSITNTTNDQAKSQLRSYLRDHIVFERNTVWKDMIGIEKTNYEIGGKGLTGDEAEIRNLYQLEYYQYELPDKYKFKLPIWYNFKSKNFIFTEINNLKIPQLFFHSRALKIYLAALVIGILLGVKTLNDEQQGNCLAVVACCAILWATEAIPLFATSLLVPILIVGCRVLKNTDGSVMSASDASSFMFEEMWSSTIMLLLGGFTLAAALSKYNVARVVSSYILFAAGDKPRNILLAIMAVALFLSMWISNVAAPVLAYSLINPLLKSLPTDSGFAQALVLGIALVCDLGGISSPISSPQNMIAIEALSPQPSWGNWFSFSIPLSIIGLVVLWVEMILTFKINTIKIKRMKPIRERFTLKQWYVIVVAIATIILWCCESQIASHVGSSGIISIIPIALYYGTGILTASDINSYPWSIVILAMGGIALGGAVKNSGLLHTIATSLADRIDTYPAIGVLAIFGCLCLVFATFVSHTVSAIILVPLVQSIGVQLNHEYLLVCGISLIASIAMGLPSSGFPNSIAISMTDDLGKRYLSTGLFISRGVPASIILFAFVITVGYGIMSSIGY